ncbi:hypothetical protein Taro_056825 [Colocasia esculenta]|uniref:Uncharacterized protein n=1 Tax=Colocasia esculenta TaxID=4460 RepID=A0A843XYJ8_COLES|nr:hypothetical protein [Colocasia esculenta]
MDALPGTMEADVKIAYPLCWQLDRYVRDEMILTEGAVAVPHRASDLLLNCDLPPPLKVFPATPRGIGDGVPVAGPPSPSPKPLKKPGPRGADVDAEVDRGGDAQDHLLKALRLSQTRAREAEKKAAALGEKNKQMASLLMEEFLRLYAHRQWLKLMEMENAWLRRGTGVWRTAGQGPSGHAVGPAPRGCVVLVVCLGIAGLGLVIGCRLMS